MPCQIQIFNVHYAIHLGCCPLEQQSVQDLQLDLCIQSEDLFLASQTDQLEDTFNVDEILQVLKKVIQSVTVMTLERLAFLLAQALTQYHQSQSVMSQCQWTLKLTKNQFSWSYVHQWESLALSKTMKRSP